MAVGRVNPRISRRMINNFKNIEIKPDSSRFLQVPDFIEGISVNFGKIFLFDVVIIDKKLPQFFISAEKKQRGDEWNI